MHKILFLSEKKLWTRAIMKYLWIFVPILALGCSLNDASARDMLQLGPQVGQRIPNDLATVDQHGTTKAFNNLRGKNGLILIFSRSLHW